MKTYSGWRYSSTQSLIPALDGGEWTALRPGRFTLTDRALGTHRIDAWVSTRAGLYTVSRVKIPCPRRESKPDHPADIAQSLYRI
jgi:hypothetical protein